MSASPVCPFCKGAISRDLAIYGGNCPHCLLEVPGEDAPTDPGAALRAKQAEEDGKRAMALARTRRIQMGAAAMVLFLLATVGGYQIWRLQQPVVYELDDYYVVPIEEIASAPSPVPVEPTNPADRKKPPRQGAGGSIGGNPTGGTSGGTAGGTRDSATGGSPVASLGRPTSGGATGDAIPSEIAAMMAGGAGGTGSVSLGGGASVDISRPGVVITDEDEIFEMAKVVINRSSPQITTCYQQRLKQVADLQGAWKVEFVITEAGGVRGVDVSAQGRRDDELESCIERAIGQWKFAKIGHDQPVAKTYRFKPSGG